MGIAPDLLPHIFELFVQADKSLERTQGGLGIGLTLAQKIMRQHGGDLTATSAGLGQGSEFTFYLPLSPAGKTPPASRPGEATEPGSGHAHDGTHGILIVDDNADEAQSLGELMDLWGYPAKLAYDGPAAIELPSAT